MLVFWAILKATDGNPGYDMKVYKESPDVYSENLGHVTLSNTARTIVVYVPMQPIDNKTLNFEQYVQYIDTTCYRMIVRNWTACSHFSDIMAHKLQQIRHTRQLADVAQREGETKRSRRGLC